MAVKYNVFIYKPTVNLIIMKDALAKGSIISWATMSCTANLWLFYGQILHCTVYCTCCNRPDLQSFKMVVGWRGCPPTLCLSTVSLALKECEAASAADVTVTVVIGFLSNPCHLYRETLKRALCFSFICPVKKKKKSISGRNSLLLFF